jgi:hypothetical protein
MDIGHPPLVSGKINARIDLAQDRKYYCSDGRQISAGDKSTQVGPRPAAGYPLTHTADEPDGRIGFILPPSHSSGQLFPVYSTEVSHRFQIALGLTPRAGQ